MADPTKHPEDAEAETALDPPEKFAAFALCTVETMMDGTITSAECVDALVKYLSARDARIRAEQPDRARVRAEVLEEAAQAIRAHVVSTGMYEHAANLWYQAEELIRALAAKGK